MATKNNRRTVITKRIFKEVLLELLREKPIYKITIKEICDSADMSRSTFYLHYQDQFELLEDIERDVLDKMVESFGDIDSDLDYLKAIELFFDYIKENANMFRILLCREENYAFRQKLIACIRSYIDREWFSSEKESAEYIYSFVINGSLSVIIRWIRRGFDVPSGKMAELVFNFCNNVA